MPIVPEVVGLPLSQAVQALGNVGLNGARVGSQFSNAVGSGLVVDSSPSAGAELADGGNVFLWESMGPEPSGLVPDVAGTSFSQAEGILWNAGYLAGRYDLHVGFVPAQVVAGTTPPAGTPVLPFAGIAVSVLVSLGDPPIDKEPPVDLTPIIRLKDVAIAQEAPRDGLCAGMAADIADLERALLELTESAAALDKLIATLEAGPDPDTATLDRLRAEQTLLAARLDSDNGQLIAWREEFSAECGGG